MNRIAVLVRVVSGIVLFSVSSLVAQQPSRPQEVYKILGISVEGNTLADPAAIIANTGLKIGDEIVMPGDQVAQAVRKLWALKLFEDIQIAIDRKLGNGIYLLIRVRELPRYERTEIAGNDEVSKDDIMKKISLVRGQVLAPQELMKIQKEITKLYEKEGFLLASVKVGSEPADSGKSRVVLKIDIDEGKEVQVSKILFEGNRALEAGDLRGAMDGISEKRWWKFWSSAKFERKKYDEDKKLIVQFYKKNGYRDAGVISDSIWYSADKKEMTILMRVYEGAQYKVRKITWEGNTVYPDAVLNARLNMLPGEIYNAEKFERNLRGNDSQTDVAALYLDNGYLTFNLEPRETRVAEDSVDIAINIFERNQFKIGHVNIKGNTKTQEKVIRRELYTRPGDFFSRDRIIRSVRQLQQLNYFNPEKIKPDYNIVDDKSVNLTYEVEEKSSDNINASVGYSGYGGGTFTGAIGFTINNFSIAEPLSGGGGQVLNFEWQFGGYNYRTFTIGFTEPWMFDTPTLFGVTLFDTRQNYIFDYTKTGGSVRVGRRFKWPDDYFRGDWIVNAQHNDIRSDPQGLEPILGRSTQVGITQVITRNSVDNPVFPSSGSNLSLSIEMVGGPVLPGDIDFHKWVLQSDWYVPMFGTNRVALYLSSQYGYIGGFKNDSKIPSVDLFFMGGTAIGGYFVTTPLRGYDDQSVGPRNILTNQVTGGKAMTKQTAELRFAVALSPIPIYLLGFAEGGNVYESISKADFFKLNRSAGFGARLQIPPIGLIGFDYGYGFDDVTGPSGVPDGKPDGWHFHFVFGRGF
jgi:outer membrane protein insertion porin family